MARKIKNQRKMVLMWFLLGFLASLSPDVKALGRMKRGLPKISPRGLSPFNVAENMFFQVFQRDFGNFSTRLRAGVIWGMGLSHISTRGLKPVIV